MIYSSIEQLIGKTPLVKIDNFAKKLGLQADILVKLEYLNPAGSTKDRAALFMLDDAEKKGLLKKGGTVIESTSGNTGIGLASICARRGYKLVLTMPETMSVERRNLLKAYGAEVVLTSGDLGMQGANEKALEIKSKTENSFIPSQFDNPANATAHYKTTAPEIYSDTDGEFDIFVACVGSGGTISGNGKYFKEKNQSIKVYAVEPENSPLLSKGVSGKHKIQGIGANFVPKNYDKTVVDGVVTVSDEDAFEYARLIAKTEGLLVGISSGAALAGAIKLAKERENHGKKIVVILPDTGDRYLSTELFD
jgi:cysteine synthase A